MKDEIVGAFGIILVSIVLAVLCMFLLFKANEGKAGNHEQENKEYMEQYKKSMEQLEKQNAKK